VAATSPSGPCGAGSCAIDRGGSVTLTAPDLAPGFRFLGWGGDPPCAGTDRTLPLVDVESSVGCAASYVQRLGAPAEVPADLHAAAPPRSAEPRGACAGPACTVARGGAVPLSAPAVAGYRFTGWTGADCGSTPTIAVRPTAADIVCTARYALGVSVGGTV